MRRNIGKVIAYLTLPGLILFCWWLWGRFDTNFFRWYLNNGALIGASTGFIALIWDDLDSRGGLISLNPVAYLASVFQLAGVVAFSIGTSLGGPVQSKVNAADSTGERWAIIWDSFASTILGLLMLAGVIVWIVVAAPLTYVVTILAGAPARRYLRGGPHRTVVQESDGQITVREVAEGAQDASFIDVTLARKPFAVTQALIALVWFIANSGAGLLF